VPVDKSGANTAAIEALVEETGHKVEIRQNKYLNNLVEQGSPGHQTARPFHAWVQVIPFNQHYLAWDRNHAHDQERADER
jgi:transposase-like protein